MHLRYRQERATQAAAHLLKLRGGRMSYMKLLKLLYLADRRALLMHGKPITFDRYVSMDHGPVLSQTYNLMVAEEAPDQPTSYWRQHISEPQAGYEVTLRVAEPPDGQLSRAQTAILDEVFAEYGTMSRWEIVRFVHTLPEWEDPQGSSNPIALRSILHAGGLDEDDASAIEAELLAEQALASLLD